MRERAEARGNGPEKVKEILYTMKKGISVLLAICMCLGFFSCGGGRLSADAVGVSSGERTESGGQRGEYRHKATPATDPADGVMIRYKCSPATAGTIVGTATQYITPDGYTDLVTAAPFYGWEFTGWSDGVTTRARAADRADEEKTYTAFFKKVEIEAKITVADIYLTTASGKSVTSKTYSSASMTISGAAKEKYNLVNVPLQIKGRGNSTWSTSYADKVVGQERWSGTKKRYEEVSITDIHTAKNSYTIKFDEGVNLLGIGSGKNRDWVLFSGKYDVTSLRNKLVYMLAERMGTLTWVPHCAWVNLYVNGEYRGLYLAEEKVEASSDRIPIDDSGTDPDKGYLVELDFRVDKDSTKKLDLDYFLIPEFHKNDANKREFDIVSDHSTPEECAFIREYLTEVDAAIRSHSKERIAGCVDLPSMVDIFIIEEFVKDCDWGATSFYMYKEKGGILHFCSPWDFDLTMGPYSSSLTLTGIISHGTSGNEWFEELHDVKWFIDMVCVRMDELEGAINEVLKELCKYAMALKPYADRNNNYYGLYGCNFHEYVSPQVSGRQFTYDEHVGFLFDWTVYRWIEMRSYYPAYYKSPFEA